MWPAYLTRPLIGYSLHQRVHTVRWESLLRHLSSEDRFNHHLINVVGPRLDRVLELNEDFDQRTDGVELPPLLQVLSLGSSFDQDAEGVV